MAARLQADIAKEGKVFFFEKKTQKAFVCSLVIGSYAGAVGRAQMITCAKA
jgi:hypothetical protein